MPNLIGLAIGAGGESTGLRAVFSGVLIALVLWCCWMAWRAAPARGAGATADIEDGGIARSIVASGWASVALLVTLSWVLPWYVLWVLPLAALSTLAQAAHDGARARRLPDHRMGARVGPVVEGDRLPPGNDPAGPSSPARGEGAVGLTNRCLRTAACVPACARPSGASDPAGGRARRRSGGWRVACAAPPARARCARRAARARARGCAPASARPGRRRRRAARRERAAAIALRLAKRRRGEHVEDRFHARGGDVGVLAAGARRAARAQRDLRQRDRQLWPDAQQPPHARLRALLGVAHCAPSPGHVARLTRRASLGACSRDRGGP